MKRGARAGTRRLWAASWVVLAICAGALLLRLAYFRELRGLFFADVLGPDEKHYMALASAIAGGDLLGGREVFFYGPLYPYFLALVHVLVGPDLDATRLVQFVLGAVACWVVYRFGRRCVSPAVGVVAAALAAVHAPFVMFQGMLLYDQLTILLMPLVLLALMRSVEGGRRRDHLAAGALLGLAALGRANVLLLLPAIWFAYRQFDSRAGRVCEAAAWWRTYLPGGWLLTVLGCAAVIAPVTIRNFAVSGDLVLITSNAGYNFYLGNGREATGGAIQPAGVDPRTDPTGAGAAALARGKPLRPSQVSAYWFARAVDDIAARPLVWLALLARKLGLLWGAHELPQIEHFAFMQRHAGALRLPHVPFGLLAPLGLVGMWVLRRQVRGQAVLVCFMISFTLSIVLFFVTARYRLPLVPVLMMYASGLLVWMYDRLRARRYRPVCVACLAAGILAVAVRIDLLSENVAKHMAAMYYRIGSVAEVQGRPQQAQILYRTAVAEYPCHAESRLNLGVLLARAGEAEEAEREFREANRCAGSYPKADYNLALLIAQQGRRDEARDLLRRAVGDDPAYLVAWHALAVMSAQAGKVAEARAACRELLARAADTDAATASLRRETAALMQALAPLREGESPAGMP